jgi:type IV secretion system protein VirB9
MAVSGIAAIYPLEVFAAKTDSSLASTVKKVFPYTDDSVFTVTCRPFMVTDMRLESGEEIQALTAGDTERWKIGQAATTDEYGQGKAHILVKPVLPGLGTNMIVVTNKRTYTILLQSTESEFDPVVEWVYGSSELSLVTPPAQQKKSEITAEDVRDIVRKEIGEDPDSPVYNARNLPVQAAALNFNYAVKGDDAVWRPEQVFDDGIRTYILMPLDVRAYEAPAFFILNGKRRVITNYRIKGRYYIVDRIFERGILTVREHKESEEVEIIRNPKKPWWKHVFFFI